MSYKSYSGRFKPSNPAKYKGDPTNIIYRSLWERKFMVWCDRNLNVMEWASEEIVIPYRSPMDNRFHRYYPDFYVKARTKDGKSSRRVIEIKPKHQTAPPKRTTKKSKRLLIKETMTYGINKAKWKAARQYCRQRGMDFVILTEKELGV